LRWACPRNSKASLRTTKPNNMTMMSRHSEDKRMLQKARKAPNSMPPSSWRSEDENQAISGNAEGDEMGWLVFRVSAMVQFFP
jgi:hypothetical protein